MAESRTIALELGYDYISTLHFLLADCRLNRQSGIRAFAFQSDDAFNSFYKELDMGKPGVLIDDLALTREAEKSIQATFNLWATGKYYDPEIQPYHLFMAMSKIKKTLFYSVFQQGKELSKELLSYYIKRGQIKIENISKGFWTDLLQRFSHSK